jgi:hypothetical protein
MTRPATADPTSCRWPSRPLGPAHRRPPATPSATQRCRFALGNALLDTSIATWNAKCLQDTVRPISYIRWRYKGTKTKGWPGPGRGTGDVDGASWDPPGTVPSRGGQRGLHQLRRRRRPGGLVAALWRHPLRGRRPQGPNPGPQVGTAVWARTVTSFNGTAIAPTTTTTTVAPTTHGGAHHHPGADHDDRAPTTTTDTPTTAAG